MFYPHTWPQKARTIYMRSTAVDKTALEYCFEHEVKNLVYYCILNMVRKKQKLSLVTLNPELIKTVSVVASAI